MRFQRDALANSAKKREFIAHILFERLTATAILRDSDWSEFSGLGDWGGHYSHLGSHWAEKPSK
jgi:hypothetical protein